MDQYYADSKADDIHFHFAEFCGAHVGEVLAKIEADCKHESYPIGQAEIKKRATQALDWAKKAVEAIDAVEQPRPSTKLIICSVEEAKPESIVDRKPGNQVVVATEGRIEQLQAIYFLMVELYVLLGDHSQAAKCENDANKLYVTHWPKSLRAAKVKAEPKGLIARLFSRGGSEPKWRTRGMLCREKWSKRLKRLMWGSSGQRSSGRPG